MMLLLLAAPALRAQGGPPFLTDDPGTPGNRHWEINVGLTSMHHSGDAEYALPDFDINYGWGDRIQLNYEAPVALTKQGPDSNAGYGNSALAVKWRFYQHMKTGLDDPQFAVSTYPRLVLENPDERRRSEAWWRTGRSFCCRWSSADAPAGLRTTARWGTGSTPTTRTSGSAAFWWAASLGKKAEAYSEIYTIQDSTVQPGQIRQRQSTLGLGGRYTLSEHLVLMGMWGRSFQAIEPGNGEANYVGYFGLQFLFGPKEKGPPQVEPPQIGY